MRNAAPEEKLDAQGALVCIAPIADFAHDPATEFVEPLHHVDDVSCHHILHHTP
jgi:hypothetical protein